MAGHSFTIGDVLPADDVLAQFIAVVAMISNDWQRLMVDMERIEDGSDREGHELLNYRLQAALHYEATHFLREAMKEETVAQFIKNLPIPARNDFEIVLTGLDSDPEIGHGSWFETNRNRTLHYSRLGRRSPVAKALRKAGAETGKLDWGRRIGLTRFGFADQIALEWLPPPTVQEERLERMSESVMSLARFADVAIGSFLFEKGVFDLATESADVGRQMPDGPASR